ncbi:MULTISPECIES: heme lyase CcmF/NrfE family subunit [unclassified Hyphomonas]|jgi:cytochrome c-type biogenesis protein CcmF|uniref:heme lyase CcmF/NrfE family subunit n=1 Tax=unclassified Hyphomonas TaxID=2630699 RepID=UPI000E83491E|nr:MULTISPECIES: heme lyase CcmF/NrfE family subunit [unclassified Hyphomonas]HAW55511.1 cytochrome C biogenesis protein CcmF [Hyphomonas sp.]HBN91632.1 cytochrome C biogenesis protein CcmF [Hyphomonas sp.]HBT36311.1 cytochrome C biogenesis protein CcmF [Hyphomonas sp.]|tara:strand:+ start:13278 stop:15161 length:1884 start_codon:yes stop_codon:yes gene_type:complete
MIELGHFAAFLALAAALAQGMFGLTGQRRMAGLAAYAGFAVMILSFVTLIVAFARSDFSVALVANNSHTLKPMIYKIAGAWGNHEGSMALWCLVTLGFGAAGALWMRTGRDLFEARALGIQGLLAVGALAYLLFASSPFLRLDPAPFQGAGLNPLLQDPALSIHPPMLYLGYVGYSFVFALAAAGLMEARVDSVWAKEARRWSLAAFIPLTLGIALGSYWAYYELGWGGWWFWDPVENASLMPWLIGAALLHSVVVTEKREGFGAWSALLAVLAFLFSIMGAFLVRSGILTSVHAFAVDPERGMLLLFGLLTYGGFALVLFAMRAPKLPGGKPWMLLSREGALMANNIVLIVAALTVLLGTLFPLMAEAAGRTISVGEPYFNLTFTPMLALLLLILPVVQAWAWGKADLKNWSKWAIAGGTLALVFLALGVGLWDISIGAALGLALGAWLVIGALWELKRRAITPGRIFRLPPRVWGMTLAHMGLGLFVIGAVVETTGRYETTVALAEGGSGTVAGWTLTLDQVRAIEGPNWYADRAQLTATRGGAKAIMTPMKRYYPAAQMPTTETAIHKTGTGDLYAALGEQRMVDGAPRWVFRVYYNPMIDLLYFGVILMALGGAFSLWPRRKA